MKKHIGFVIVLLCFLSCSSDENRFKKVKENFHAEWFQLHDDAQITTTKIYDVNKFDDEKIILKHAVEKLGAINPSNINEDLKSEFQLLKISVEQRIDFLENKINTDPSVFSMKNYLEKFLNNEDGFGTEELKEKIKETVESFPHFYEVAKKKLTHPELEKINIALEDQKSIYFLLKNNISKWIKENAETGLELNVLEEKNRNAQLAVKDFIAFLNSAKFEIGDNEGEHKSDL